MRPIRILATAATAIWILAAQTVPFSQQLASAIHAQDTAGNLDEAIRLYRQVLAAAPPRAQAVEAHFRLTQCLLHKGDLKQAAAELQILAATYPDQHALVASLSQRLSARTKGPRTRLGKVDPATGSYEHTATGIRVPIPSGWRVTSDWEISDGDMLGLYDSASGAHSFVFMSQYNGNGMIDAELREDLAKKHKARGADWRVRPETIHRIVIGGEQAIVGAADYTEEMKRKVEYLVWMRNPKARLFFSARVPAEDFRGVESRLANFASQIRLPD